MDEFEIEPNWYIWIRKKNKALKQICNNSHCSNVTQSLINTSGKPIHGLYDIPKLFLNLGGDIIPPERNATFTLFCLGEIKLHEKIW